MFGFTSADNAQTVVRKRKYMTNAQARWPFLTSFDATTISTWESRQTSCVRIAPPNFAWTLSCAGMRLFRQRAAQHEAGGPAQGVPNSVVVQKPYPGAQLLTAISTLLTAAKANKTSWSLAAWWPTARPGRHQLSLQERHTRALRLRA